uniref:Protein kinase domain-containing protein n=1 Tax=Rhabditophanes sp. KR3021 TaxID=114890 RepID=A0AC35UAN3_9BILA
MAVQLPANQEPKWLDSGEIIKGRYEVSQMVSAGGFGQVYWATDLKTGHCVAVKAEKKGCKISLLKEEAMIVSKINRSAFKRFTHIRAPIIRLYDYIETDSLKMMVMSMCGPNLRELKKSTEFDKFSPITSFWIAKKMICALKTLHNFGWIHRDIKPANFTIGLGREGGHRLFIVDFGLARRYMGSDGSLKPIRESCNFRGTIRYASLNAHKRRDLSRSDDLWSVYYIAVENILGKLPWRASVDRDEVGKMKSDINLIDLKYNDMHSAPKSYIYLKNHLELNGFYHEPKYDVLIQQFDGELCALGYHSRYNNTLDWESIDSTSKIMEHKKIAVSMEMLKNMNSFERINNYFYNFSSNSNSQMPEIRENFYNMTKENARMDSTPSYQPAFTSGSRQKFGVSNFYESNRTPHHLKTTNNSHFRRQQQFF